LASRDAGASKAFIVGFNGLKSRSPFFGPTGLSAAATGRVGADLPDCGLSATAIEAAHHRRWYLRWLGREQMPAACNTLTTALGDLGGAALI